MSKREWRGGEIKEKETKNGGTNPKMAERRRRNIGSVRGEKIRMGTESASGQGGENEEVTKQERSKHKFKSFKRKRVEMSTSICF